jgi:hypothetical protein
MINKQSIIIIIVVFLALGIMWQLGQKANTITFGTDTIVNGDYTIQLSKRLELHNGAKLTINGNLRVDGEIHCKNGFINIIVNGAVNINNKLICQDPQGSDIGEGISLVVADSINFEDNAELISNGHIQITDNEDSLAKTQEQIDSLYEQAATDTGEPYQFGPMLPAEDKETLSNNQKSISLKQDSKIETNSGSALHYIIGTAKAQAGPMVNIKGKIKVNTPKKGVKRIVVFYFPNASGFNIQDFELTGPDGRKGNDDIANSCNAKGSKGENAFRFLAFAPNITVNSFNLQLGNGGNGGDAETKKDCDPGIAEGGNGGKASNFKIIASKNFQIKGAFNVYPGKGGDGGKAIAHGKDGDPGKGGGDAKAFGGDGVDNKKKLTILGSISGTSNVKFGSMYGGNGGNAFVNPGKGGNGLECANGGNGGNGIAIGGKGGDTSIALAGNVQRTDSAEDIGGNGGDSDSKGGHAGNGGDCDQTAKGGNGGKGGDADTTAGLSGTGPTANGQDGNKNDETGGDGGNGGNGCPEGKLGKGGNGIPPGKDGVDGKNICSVKKPKTTGTIPDDSQPEEEPADTSLIDININELFFEHQIGPSDCPQLIGNVQISKTGEGPSSEWRIKNVPYWITVEESGTIPETINLYFNCQIEQHITQTLSAQLNLQLFDQNGNSIGQGQNLQVTGYISKE